MTYQNFFVTLYRDNKTTTIMITKYISYLRDIRNYSENTLIGYEKDLSAFSKWAKAHLDHARWSEITRTDIDQYVHAMVASGMKPSSTNRRLSAISGLYEYFKREGYQVENPCKYESRRKVSKSLPNTINEEELRAAYENAAGVTKTMIGILMSTGIRIQEMLDLSWEDIDFTECSLRINGKGAKQRVVYSTREILADLAFCKSQTNARGQMFGIDQRTARHMIFDALRPFCSAKQLSPHAIRHTWATHFAKMGANVSQIGTLLGHEHLETTQKYIDMCQHNHKEIVEQYSII